MKKVASLLNLLTVTLCISVIAAGCAGLGKAPSDEELIRGTLEKMKTALETKRKHARCCNLGWIWDMPRAAR
jgi:DNA-binding FadR family transcriptional regulator